MEKRSGSFSGYNSSINLSEMKTAELGDYFLWKGEVVKVHAINPGKKAICFTVKERVHCPSCGDFHLIDRQMSVIEGSPQFQENALPLTTIK